MSYGLLKSTNPNRHRLNQFAPTLPPLGIKSKAAALKSATIAEMPGALKLSDIFDLLAIFALCGWE